jgi:hypothetical protein
MFEAEANRCRIPNRRTALALRPKIESLVRVGFRADPDLVDRVPKVAGEELKP